ncbi:peptidylprolyl isomerase [Pelagicoccus sp. SDUM812003]|uniref:peptidylprolyl isomerase n=1 Tax=Pelagicoccus sp. SDUM812003 TaxID=3041267 RepID=UPI00280E3852|nr:peptidylprolyl isomerase [Pelagicoccus sp. SDUM812003]MDQ8203235.1 peptidylprolyl isomerase [Pelagicoccus sp. SDUM812003]
MAKFPKSISLIILSSALLALLSGCAKKETQLHATIETSMGDIVVKLLDQQAPKTVANFVGLADGTRLLEDGQPVSEAEPFYDGLIFHRVIPDFMIQGGCPQGNGMGGPGYTFEDETYTEGEPITGPIPDIDTAEYVFEQLVVPHLRQHQGNSPIPEIAELFGKLREAQSFEPMVGMEMADIAKPLGFEGELKTRGELIDSVRYGTLCMANAGPNTNGSQFFIVTKEGGAPWLDGKHTVFGEVISGMDVALAIQNVERGPQDKPLEDVVIKSISVETVKVKVEEPEKE